ncbi:hypothetical protein ADUPG1_006818, partial [Aduncisulcus paluster]
MAEQLKTEGNSFFGKGEYDKAVQKYTQALDLDSDNAFLYANRAAALLQLKQYKKAKVDSEKALSLKPNFSKALLRLATAELCLGDPKKSLANISKVVASSPTNASALDIYRKAKYVDRVLSDLDSQVKHEAKALVDSIKETLSNNGDLIIASKKPDPPSSDEGSKLAHLERTYETLQPICYLDSQVKHEAKALVDSIKETLSNNGDLIIASKKPDPPSSDEGSKLAHLERTYETLQPICCGSSTIFAYSALIMTLRAQSWKLVHGAQGIAPTDLSIFARGMKKKLHERLKQAQTIDSNNSELWLCVAMIRLYDKDIDNALSALRHALSLSPDDPSCQKIYRLLKRAKSESDKGKAILSRGANKSAYEQAMTHFNSAIDSYLGDNIFAICSVGLISRVVGNRSVAWQKLEQTDKAVGDSTLAVQLDPLYEKAYQRRCTHLISSGEHQQICVSDANFLTRVNPSERAYKELKRKAESSRRKNARKDYYKILGVEKGANAAMLKKAFRKKALKYHPDKVPHDASPAEKEEADKCFKDVNEAYNVLNDERKRQIYDAGEEEKVTFNSIDSKLYIFNQDSISDLQRANPDELERVHFYGLSGSEIRLYSNEVQSSGNSSVSYFNPPLLDSVSILDTSGAEVTLPILFGGPANSLVEYEESSPEAPDVISLVPLDAANAIDHASLGTIPISTIGIHPEVPNGRYLLFICEAALNRAVIDYYNENMIHILTVRFTDVTCDTSMKLHLKYDSDNGINLAIVDETATTMYASVYSTPLGDMHVANYFPVTSGSPNIELGRKTNDLFRIHSTHSCDLPISESSPCLASFRRTDSMILPHEDENTYFGELALISRLGVAASYAIFSSIASMFQSLSNGTASTLPSAVSVPLSDGTLQSISTIRVTCTEYHDTYEFISGVNTIYTIETSYTYPRTEEEFPLANDSDVRIGILILSSSSMICVWSQGGADLSSCVMIAYNNVDTGEFNVSAVRYDNNGANSDDDLVWVTATLDDSSQFLGDLTSITDMTLKVSPSMFKGRISDYFVFEMSTKSYWPESLLPLSLDALISATDDELAAATDAYLYAEASMEAVTGDARILIDCERTSASSTTELVYASNLSYTCESVDGSTAGTKDVNLTLYSYVGDEIVH